MNVVITENTPENEPREMRIKRLQMRSIRRGIKEMDLILGSFARCGLSELSDDELRIYDELLRENDHDLYRWASAQSPAPEHFSALMSHIMGQVRLF